MNWSGRQILSPLTKGGNLPFRRLCVGFGAQVTVSEMAYARQLMKGSRSEMALLRHHETEAEFGVQIAASKPEDAAKAANKAVERGARFVDLNCGCPIHDVVRRGMGATLLQREKVIGRIVEAMVAAVDVPITVKIRAGFKEGKVNAPEVARIAEEAGAAALTLHARTREQRYSRAADWDLIAQVVSERSIPVIGNGDVLTWYEARDRIAHSGCASVMIARAALIKPWVFQEMLEQRTVAPSAEERLEIYWRFGRYMREHFYDDERGRKRAMNFLPWHFGFFWRYRPLPEEQFAEASKQHPLMQTRIGGEAEAAATEPLEALFRDPRAEVHEQLAAMVWDCKELDQARTRCQQIYQELPAGEDEAATAEIRTSHG